MEPLPYSELVRLCIQAPQEENGESIRRPQSEPIELTGVWQIDDPKSADGILSGAEPGYVYRRDGHPNATSLGGILRRIHQADEAILTAQGMSALAAAALAILSPGDSVVIGQPVYGKSTYLFATEMARWNIRVLQVPANDEAAWIKALSEGPKLALIETITNPRMSVPDIAWIAKHCRSAGTVLMVDNTFATPLLCQPLNLGADLVMESLTKLVCGHSDAMLGLLCGRKEVWSRIASVVSTFGLASSPLDCWLTRRGLATLPVRLDVACKNAQHLAEGLSNHPSIQSIDYPGLTSHPHHEIARRQFQGRFGNMMTIHLSEHLFNDATSFIRKIRASVPFCPSLGENQTTLSHPASTSHRAFSPAELSSMGISQRTLRISVGIEDTDWLLTQFLNALHR